MDALLLALLGCALVEVGGPASLLAARLAARLTPGAPLLCGLLLATATNAALAAAAGWFVAGLLGGQARLLFLALALLVGGVSMLLPVRQPDSLDGWRTGAFLTGLLGFLILGFGDSASFLILGIVAKTGNPVLAASGGTAGVLIAVAPALLVRDFAGGVPLAIMRRIGGGILCLGGALTALSALGLL